MTETTTPEIPDRPRPERGAGRRLRIRRLHWHLGIWTLVSILLVSLFLTLASMSFTGRVIVLPDWVSERVLDRMNAAMPSGSFTLRQVEFGVTPKGRPRLRLVDVGIKDATGLELAQLNRVEGGFSLGAALRGRLEPTGVSLQGAQVTLRRLSDGSFALSLGQRAGASGDLASLLDAIDSVFTGGPLATTERIEASELTITLEDARSGRLWQVTDGRMSISQTDRLVDITVSFDVFNQTEELAHTVFSFRSAKDSSEASLSARFENAAAADIAAQAPALAFLAVIDAPISGALRASIGADGALSELAGTMQIGSGALSPTPGAQPATFNGAKVYIDFNPQEQRLDFQGASISSDLGTAEAEGHVYLTDFNGGWPGSLIGQVTLNAGQLNPTGMFPAPVDIDHGVADIRVRLDPFTIDIGQAVVFRGAHRYQVSGRVGAASDGWSIALDGGFETADRPEILALWPLQLNAGTRKWVIDNVLGGEVFDGKMIWRKAPGEALRFNAVYGVRDATVVAMNTLPPVEVDLGYITQTPTKLTVVAETARTTAPDGSVMDLSGMSYLVPDLTQKPSSAVINLKMAGPVRGALSLLELPPFSVFQNSTFGPDMARGTVDAGGRITFPLTGKAVPVEDFTYDISAQLSDVSSDVLVENKLLLADALDLVATNDGVEISGPVRIGQAEAFGTWRLPMVAGKAGAPSIEGTVELSQRAFAELGLEDTGGMVSGAARGQFTIAFPAQEPPRVELRSDLGGLAMQLPGTGWSKAAGTTGSLTLAAVLGDRPEIEEITLSAPGLDAHGRISTAEGGGLGEARFDRVQIGGWLDAPVVLTGRGPEVPIGIAVTGGTIDMRKADLGGGGSGARGPRQPLTLALDRLIVSEGIRLTNLRADLDLAGGMTGTFTGNIGSAAINGSMAQQAEGAAFRITSSDAGEVMRGAGVFETARGGDLELILAPAKAAGTYDGEFTVKNTRIVKAPAMAELLAAVSVVGLIDQLNGEGIGFSEVEGRFRLTPDSVTLYRSSAVSVSMGISMDGYYDMRAGQIDMQGVLSPFYIFNALGRVFSARDGEGLVGFNFTLKGPYSDPAVGINPLSILTPGVFREIFRRAPPEVPTE